MQLTSVPPADQAASTAPFDAIAAAGELAQRLSETAVERDRAGGHAGPERELIRASGLLALSVPRAYGGPGADWATVLRTVRIVAGADSALAHLLGFHHLQLAGLQLYGNPAQQRRLLAATIEERIFWGNALNPLDKRLVATPTAGGYLLNGTKSFASGSVGSDWLTISAWNPLAGAALIAVLPTRHAASRYSRTGMLSASARPTAAMSTSAASCCRTTWCCRHPARPPRRAAPCARRWRS